MKQLFLIIAIILFPLGTFAYRSETDLSVERLDKVLSYAQQRVGVYDQTKHTFYMDVYSNLLKVYVNEASKSKKLLLQGVLSYWANNYRTGYEFDTDEMIETKAPQANTQNQLRNAHNNDLCPGEMFVLANRGFEPDEGSQEILHQYDEELQGFTSIYNPYIFEEYCKIGEKYFVFRDSLFLRSSPRILVDLFEKSLATNNIEGLKKSISLSHRYSLSLLPLFSDMSATQLDYLGGYKNGHIIFGKLQTFEREGYALFYLSQDKKTTLTYSLLYGFDSVQMSQGTNPLATQFSRECDAQLYKNQSLDTLCLTKLKQHISEKITQSNKSSYPLDRKAQQFLSKIDKNDTGLHAYRENN